MRKFVKITLWIIGSLLFLILATALCLNSQWGQNIVRGKAESFLTDKLKTEVKIGFLGIGFPKFIVIKNVLLKDQVNDTLLSLQELKVDLDMMALIRSRIDVNQLVLTGVHSHVYRHLHDTDFNFTYIINAFAGDKKAAPSKPKDTTAKPLNINVGKVKLDDIHIRFDDYTGGTLLAVNLDHLSLRLKSLDIDKMMFHVKELSVAGLQGAFTQDTSYLPPSPHTPGNTDIQFIADDIELQKVAFRYADNPGKLSFAVNLGLLNLQLNKFGLAENVVDIKTLAVDNMAFSLVMGKKVGQPGTRDTTQTAGQKSGWSVIAGEIKLKAVDFKMDNENEPRIPKGIDYAHLGVKGVGLTLTEAQYNSDSLSGNLEHLVASEQSGVQVNELRTVFRYNNHGAVLDKLYLETPNTVIQDHLEVHYASLDSIKAQLGQIRLNVNLRKSKVAVSDVLLFVPQLEEQQMFEKNKDGLVAIEAKVDGFLEDLNIPLMHVTGLQGTEVLLSGKLAGLPESEKLTYDLNIAKFESTSEDVASFVPDSVLKSIRIPDRFLITGNVAGTIRDYHVNVNLSSTDGLAYLRGTLAMSPGKGREKYDLVMSTAQLNIGHILRQDSTIGAVSAHFVVKGTGLDPETMTANVDGRIISAMAMGYPYHDISLLGKVAAKKGTVDMIAADPNVRIQVKGQADFSGKYPAVVADIRIDSIDLQALKLYKTEFRASGTMHADFPELNPDYPRGRFTWWQPVVTVDGKRYYMDSLYVSSQPNADTGQNIIVDLGILSARVTGKIPLSQIGPVVQEHIRRHYAFPSKDSLKKNTAAIVRDTIKLPLSYSLNITADVVDKPMLRSILPGLTSFDSIHLGATITSRILNLDLSIPNLVYGTTTIENGIVEVKAADSAFTYKVTANKISTGSFSIGLTNIHGSLDQNTITTNLAIADFEGVTRFALAANMQKIVDSQVVHLLPGLKLDYNDWAVAQPNRIVLHNGGFYIRNFEISDSGQYIRVNSTEARINAPMKVDIHNFMLSNITRAISGSDTLLAGGLLSGIVDVQQFTPSVKVVGKLEVAELSILGDTLGNLTLNVNNKTENTLEAKVTLSGHGNDIAVNGSYFLQPVDGNEFKFNLDINALAIRSVESIAQHQIKNSSGYLRGKLALSGTVAAPEVTGELHTDKVVTTVSQLNATFKMPSENIAFTKDVISFNNFTIGDNDDNKATLNGTINTHNLAAIELDMKIRAKDWRALHSTINDNKMYFGDLLLTTNLNIKGTPTAPVVDGDLKILKGTDVTIINPESNPHIESRKGIVVFVNMKDTARRNILAPKKKDNNAKKVKGGSSDFNVNITIDKAAQFSLVLDQASGDFLSVKGEANINASLTPGGTISLAGNYALNDGAYQLNYNFVKRKFKIAPGSTITFAGDPVSGTKLDVTAVYEAQVSAYDLVQRQVSDPAQLNYYKQRMPFNVNLYMNGPVLKPRLTFDIVLPESKAYRLSADQIGLIQGKLSQVRTDTSELNKQVFAVLILNRFVSDDPFSSGAGSSASFTALQSVSTFIGEQLNRAADNLVKGVDFSVDLATTEDYTTGSLRQRTDLNLAASKRLLNDRLKLTLGNNFELEGPQTSNGNQSGYVPTNLAADYLLTADGKYTVRAYRRAYDVGVLQGYVTETGLNFIVSYDYNKIKNVFRKKRDVRDTAKVNDKNGNH